MRSAQQTVYNFQVEGVHNYAVGSVGVLVHNKPAANVLPEGTPLSPGWNVIEHNLVSGEKGRAFVLIGASETELFSAIIMNGSKTLEVSWTATLGQKVLVGRIGQLEKLAGGPNSFNKITGYATDGFYDLIKAGKFNTTEIADLLGKGLGGKWEVKVVPRPGSPKVDVTATRIGD